MFKGSQLDGPSNGQAKDQDHHNEPQDTSLAQHRMFLTMLHFLHFIPTQFAAIGSEKEENILPKNPSRNFSA